MKIFTISLYEIFKEMNYLISISTKEEKPCFPLIEKEELAKRCGLIESQLVQRLMSYSNEISTKEGNTQKYYICIVYPQDRKYLMINQGKFDELFSQLKEKRILYDRQLMFWTFGIIAAIASSLWNFMQIYNFTKQL